LHICKIGQEVQAKLFSNNELIGIRMHDHCSAPVGPAGKVIAGASIFAAIPGVVRDAAWDGSRRALMRRPRPR
jgi:hypothetical protein